MSSRVAVRWSGRRIGPRSNDLAICRVCSIAIDEGLDVWTWHRLSEEEALHLKATFAAEEIDVLFAFYAFGENRNIKALRKNER